MSWSYLEIGNADLLQAEFDNHDSHNNDNSNNNHNDNNIGKRWCNFVKFVAHGICKVVIAFWPAVFWQKWCSWMNHVSVQLYDLF